VRLTLGDVVIARKDVKVRHPRSGVFANQLHISVAELGGDVSTNRSWNSFDAVVHGAHLRFVNAHLEAYSNDFKLAQAKELVAGPLKHKGTTILAGDLNSGPTLPNAADRPPYQAVAAAGFRPYRTKKNSCCFDEIDTGSGSWDHNVDWIMARPKVKLLRSYVTGRERTKRGVYPSDHGGVVSVLRVKR
jgi:endonuclease/exonuclease/phosphatase family metal-dependent hydrolase